MKRLRQLSAFALWGILLSFAVVSSLTASDGGFQYKKDPYLRFRNFSPADGLGSGLVLAILQDDYGIMWFGTTTGLTRYDGRQFRIYQNQDNRHSLSDNLVTSLAEDIYGNIWVGTGNGLNRYDRGSDTFVRYGGHGEENPILSNSYVRALYADGDGYLWVETRGGFLSRLDTGKGEWVHKSHAGRDFEGEYYYHRIFEDPAGSLWLGGRNMSLKVLHEKDMGRISEVDFEESLLSKETAGVATTPDGTLFFTNYPDNLVRYDPESDRIEPVLKLDISPVSMASDERGRLWAGGKDGLRLVDLAEKTVKVLENDPSNPNSLLSSVVYSLYKDQDGGIWVGTDKGVSYCSHNLNLIRHYRFLNGVGQGMTSDAVTTLMSDSDGLLWVGTAENGVDTVSLAHEQFGNLTYELLSNDIDPQTFEREKEVLKQYFRHRFIVPERASVTEAQLFASYEIYRNTPKHFTSTNENRVSALYQDRAGNIYVGLWAHAGFNVYDKDKDVFKRYALWSKESDHSYPRIFEGNLFGSNWYNGFLEDRRGNLWIATWEGVGLNLFDRERGVFLPRHYMPGNLPGKNFLKLVYDAGTERMYMAGTHYYGYYDSGSDRYIRYATAIPKDYPNKEILEGYTPYFDARFLDLPSEAVFIDYVVQDSVVWISTHNALVKHILGTDIVETVLQDIEIAGSLLVEGSDGGTIWLAKSGGIRRIDARTNRSETVLQLPGEEIFAIREDRKGTLWIGTDKNLYPYDISENKLLPAIRGVVKVSCLYNDRESGDLFVGCETGFVRVQDRQIISEMPFGGSAPGLPGTSISQIYRGSDGVFWIGTNGGLVQMDPDTGERTVFVHNAADRYSLIDNRVYSICEDGNGDLWVSTISGLCRLDRNIGQFIDMSQPDDRTLTSRLTSCLMEDHAGKIWIGTTENGVSVLDPRTDRLRHFIHQSWDKNSLSDNYVNCIFEDSRNIVWIGTRKGLDYYEPQRDSLARAGSLEGYRVMHIEEDASGKLWASTNDGLFCLDAEGNVLRTLRDFPGLPGPGFGRAGTRLPDGRLAFGGNYGFCVFDPATVMADFQPKRVVISGFAIRDSLRYGDATGLTEVVLRYRDNSFSLSFSAPDYDTGDRIHYRYKLEGFDREWIYTEPPLLSAKYTNLPPGKYIFTVEASNGFGEWHDVVTRLPIGVKTPWYRQAWFFILLLLLVAGGIRWFVRYREKRLKEENLRLEKMVEDRTGELTEANRKLTASETELRAMNDSKNKFFSIISHDLRNPLKALNLTARSLYEQYDTLNEDEKYNIVRVMHESTGQTGQLLENLLMWVVSQMKVLKPEFRVVNLSGTIESTFEVLELIARKKNIRLITTVSPDVRVWADENLLSTILRNLVSNAIHFSYSGAEVTVYAEERDDKVFVSVADQGVGISKENQQRLFRPDTKLQTKGTDNEPGTGLGLVIAGEFIRLLGGEISLHSEKGKGTIFTLSLKTYNADEPR